MYGEGRGAPQDYVQAHMWYNLAASRLTGGLRYMSGRSLRQDCLEAVQWYRGVLKTHAEAHHWLRLARAQRDPVLRYNLIRKAAWRLSMGF